ncbi:phosphate acyltransferase [Planctomicrobium piriforme]|uniref:Phosphate butyryltransferase n=1 Tax=Planctomicrobium piriforme TaxID=1576369 RepID=A0A1I3ILS9_9PLAN|nr:phosphate acyltransferase [Planctomicrobium piriforme]SFI48896.1 phosphate butyryltransferase [Planctomicrobium piriforme]
MPLKSFDALFAAADQLPSPVPVAAAGGADSTVIQALELARRRGWIHPILTGDLDRISQIADQLDIDLGPFDLVAEPVDSAIEAVKLVRKGQARLLMKGQIATPALMKAVLDKEHGLRTGKTICQVVLMEITRDQRSFLMTDTGVTITPTLDQKRDLIETVVATAQHLGAPTPRVALMSATEKVTPALPDTLETDKLVELGREKRCGDCLVQGPLSFDLAYATDAGQKKGIGGDVTGAADAMVFPDLLSANLTVKGIMYTADCRFGGVLRGTTSPVVFMSRADTVETRMNSLAYALSLLGTRPR